jgi:hypothetical protein
MSKVTFPRIISGRVGDFGDCHGHQNPRNLAMPDAMRPPVVESINLDGLTVALPAAVCGG